MSRKWGERTPKKRPPGYRGADNPGNPHAPAKAHKRSGREVRLVPVEKGDPTKGGRRSRRIRKFKWVPA